MAQGSREQREARPARGHPTTTWEQARRKPAHLSGSFRPRWLYSPWNSPGQIYPEHLQGRCSLLQGIFPTQGSNPGLLHCRQIPYSWAACAAVHAGNSSNSQGLCGCNRHLRCKRHPRAVIRKQFEACWAFNKSILRGQLKVRCLSPQPFSESTRKYAPHC